MPKLIPTRKPLLKKLPDLIGEVPAAHPSAHVETWAFDEHRIGLKSILRRIWAQRGHRPMAVVAYRYQWMYV